jgi:hypothetical protein
MHRVSILRLDPLMEFSDLLITALLPTQINLAILAMHGRELTWDCVTWS